MLGAINLIMTVNQTDLQSKYLNASFNAENEKLSCFSLVCSGCYLIGILLHQLCSGSDVDTDA